MCSPCGRSHQLREDKSRAQGCQVTTGDTVKCRRGSEETQTLPCNYYVINQRVIQAKTDFYVHILKLDFYLVAGETTFMIL